MLWVEYPDIPLTSLSSLIAVGPSPRLQGKDHAIVLDSDCKFVYDPYDPGIDTPIPIEYYLVFDKI